ncbi:MAG TPA: FecR domain-containing protein [Chthoniobacterales bacterium]|nr:FecR domain-containing protein [Chthoniobacterales bacterium]
MKPKILSSSLAILLVAGHTFGADSKKEARVTQIIHDVKILPSDAAARAAVVNDRIADDTGVRTGGDSRSELTFADLTITRLGSNTIFSFNKAGRNAQVDSGSILLRVPKDSGGGRIKTSAVTVAVTGTTVIVESTRGGRNKLIVLEGSARISLVKYPKQFQNVRGAQMVDVPAGASTIPLPVNVDLNDLMKKHPLITDFPPLPSRDLIVATSQEQPPPSGPSVFPIIPVIDFGGGFHTGPHHGPRRPPPRNQPPGNDNTHPPGNSDNPKPTPTPPPVIYRKVPGQTQGPAATTTNQNGPKKSPTPTKKYQKPTKQQNNGPR